MDTRQTLTRSEVRALELTHDHRGGAANARRAIELARHYRSIGETDIARDCLDEAETDLTAAGSRRAAELQPEIDAIRAGLS